MSRAPSPTNTEWDMFQVMANPSFINLSGGRPTFSKPEEVPPPPSPPGSPVAESEILDSVSVVAEKAAVSAFKPILTKVEEESESEDEAVEETRPETPPPPPRSESPVSVESSVEEAVPPVKTPEDIRVKARQMTEADILLEKEGLLAELSMMQKQGVVTLYRELTMRDSLEEIQFQYDRALSHHNAMQTVEMAKTGMKVMSTLMEMMFNKMGLKLLDGFSGHLCKDMNRFNRPFTKMYRKYWRGGNMSPESELAFIVFGSVLVTILHNKGLGMFAGMMPSFDGGSKEAPSATPPLARPVVPTPTTHSPAVPVMRRPTAQVSSAQVPPPEPTPIPEPPKKTVSIGPSKTASKKSSKHDNEVLNL